MPSLLYLSPFKHTIDALASFSVAVFTYCSYIVRVNICVDLLSHAASWCQTAVFKQHARIVAHLSCVVVTFVCVPDQNHFHYILHAENSSSGFWVPRL